MNAPNKRELKTEHGKPMFLYPDTMGFSAEGVGNKIELQDDGNMAFSSSKKVFISAEGDILLKGKSIKMEIPTEIKMKYTR